MTPLISIITPAYNAEHYLAQTIESVLAQTFFDWQMIIVNDGSTDKTGQLADQYANKDSRIQVVHQKHSSGRPGIARNIGLEYTKGRYIALLDADDLWMPQKLEHHLRFIQKHEAAFSCTSYQRISVDGKPFNTVHVKEFITRNDILITNTIGCLTVMFDRDQLPKLSFDVHKDLVGREDYSLWLKILSIEQYAYGLNETLSSYRVVGNSISRNKFNMAKGQWRVLRYSAKMPLIKAIFYMFTWAFFGYLRNRHR